MRKLLIIALVLCATIGCNSQKDIEFHKVLKLDVNCGDKYKGIVYKLKRNGVSRLETESGLEIEIPHGCVFIILEEYCNDEGNVQCMK